MPTGEKRLKNPIQYKEMHMSICANVTYVKYYHTYVYAYNIQIYICSDWHCIKNTLMIMTNE